MERIAGSVGRGGRNLRADVIKIQRLINADLPIPLAPLAEDGVCGPQTISAIGEYQRRKFAMNPADCRVDPGGRTFRALTGSAPCQAVPPTPALARPANPERRAMDFFVNQGWSREQAAGIVANLLTESQLAPDAVGDGGQARGIAQWHPDRQAAFQRFTGQPIRGSTLDQQLQFVQQELTAGGEVAAGRRLRGAASANDAGATVSQFYERPADRDGEARRRGQRAEQVLDNYR